MEIDLREVFLALRKRAIIICIVSFLGAMAAFGFTKLFMTPIFTAENSMLVLTNEATVASLSDLQMGSQLINDYKALTVSRPVLEKVIEKLDLDMTYNDLAGTVSVKNQSNTRIMNISVSHTNPEMALEIVRSIAKEASVYISDMMGLTPPKIIFEGVVPTEKTSPNTTKNTLIGFLAGAFLSCGIVVLITILDDTIKSEEDIAKYLELPTLSSVPDRKDFINTSKDKTSKNGKFAFFSKNKSKKG